MPVPIGFSRVVGESGNYHPYGETSKFAFILPVRVDFLCTPETIRGFKAVRAGYLVDLLAFRPEWPDRWALRCGAAEWLGSIPPQYCDPDPVRIWSSPVRWLQSSCDGLVMLCRHPLVRTEVSPCFPSTAPAACIAGARLSMPRTRISGNEATRATAPVANIAAFRPTLAATASIATCDGRAEKTGEGVDRKGATEPHRRDLRREDRVIGGMKHAPGKPNKAYRDQQRGIGRRQAQGYKGGSADRESKHQHQPRADLVDEKPDRQLSRDRGDAGDGQRKAQFDKADAERHLQEREQGRQNQTLKMLDEVRDRNDRDRAGLAPSPAASRLA